MTELNAVKYIDIAIFYCCFLFMDNFPSLRPQNLTPFLISQNVFENTLRDCEKIYHLISRSSKIFEKDSIWNTNSNLSFEEISNLLLPSQFLSSEVGYLSLVEAYNFGIHLTNYLFILLSMNDKTKKVLTLIGTFFVVNILSILSGFLYEKVAKSSYHNTETNHYEQFRSSIGYCVVLKFVTWLLAELYRKITVKKEDQVAIEKKKSFACGLIITISSISFMEALYLISYPFIMMAKSASVLQVVLIGVFCAQVKDQNGKPGKGKIFNAFIVTLGVVLFKLFDPQTSFHAQRSRQIELLGFLLLMVNIIADCFYPQFQTEIQRNSNPKPAQMLAELSKWSFIISFILSIVHGDLIYTINFMNKHPSFIVQILALGLLSFLGQTFVYNIIQNFEEKFVPLVNTTRKTFTVAFNLIVFGHRTSFGQISGILIAFSATIWQFLETLSKRSQKEMTKQYIKLNQIYEIEPQFGPFGMGKQQVGKDEEYQEIRSTPLGFLSEQQEQSTFESS